MLFADSPGTSTKAISAILLGSATAGHGLANADRQLGQGKDRLLSKSVLKMFRAGISACPATPSMLGISRPQCALAIVNLNLAA